MKILLALDELNKLAQSKEDCDPERERRSDNKIKEQESEYKIVVPFS